MSPRQLYQADKRRVLAHKDVVDSPAVKEALVAAFSHMGWNLAGGQDLYSAAKRNAMIEGAKLFIEEFRNLAEENPFKPTPVELSGDLEPDPKPKP